MNNQIQLKTLKFRNIFSYGNKWNTFNFKTGISFISGKNVLTGRRNFTGKSSLLKIIPFALFGKVDGINKSQIINWKNKKQTEVILTFTKGKSEYTIHRGIKPDIFNVIKDDKDIPQSSNKKIFQEEIEDTVLQMDFTTFMNIVYCDTNNNMSILNASKPIKRAYIEKLFNLAYFTNLKDIANAKKKVINEKIVDVNNNINTYVNKIKLSSDNNTQYKIDIKRCNKDVDDLTNDINSLDIDSEKRDTMVSKLNSFKSKQDEINKSITDSKLLLEKVKAKKFYLSRFKVNNDISQEEMDILDKKITENNTAISLIKDKIAVSNIDIDEAETTISQMEAELSQFNDNIKQKTFILNQLNTDISNLKKELLNKPKDGTCPLCLQTVDFKHIENEYNTMLSTKMAECDTISAQLYDLNSDHDVLNEKYNSEVNTLKDYESLLDLYDNKKITDKALMKEKKGHNRYIRKVKKLKRYKRASDKFDILLNKIQSDIDGFPSYEKEISVCESELSIYDHDKQQYIRLTEKKNGIIDKIDSLKDYITTTTEQIKQDEEQINSERATLNKYNTVVEYIKQVIIICGDDQCKQYAISNFLPYFNERINYYLNKSGVLFYIKLSGWLDYDILGPGINNCSYDNLSGAERISVDRSIQLASMDMKKQQSNSLIDILILDEVLDSSVDDIGLSDMMNIIKTKQEDDQSKVLIVSHRNELGTLNNMFDHRYVVEIDKYSTVKEV